MMTLCIVRTRLLFGIGLVGLNVMLGCSSDTTGLASNAPDRQYWQLTLNHHAITLALTAPYNTIQLVDTPRTVTGVPLTDTGTTKYTVSYIGDNCGCQSITVSPTGLVTADSVDADVTIYASRTIGGITLVDSAYVNVNDVSSIPVFTTIKLQPQPGDSARQSISGYFHTPGPAIVPQLLDNIGNNIPNTVVNFTAPKHPEVLETTPPVFPGSYPEYLYLTFIGSVWIYAEATVYGVTKTDSLLYTVTAPLIGNVGVYPGQPTGRQTPLGYFRPGNDTVAVGATVLWENQLNGLPIDIVFDNPTAAQGVDSVTFAADENDGAFVPNQGGGNIPSWNRSLDTVGTNPDNIPITVSILRARQFPHAGIYPYHSALYGTTGVITVVQP